MSASDTVMRRRDVLSPEVILINGNRYRKNPGDPAQGGVKDSSSIENQSIVSYAESDPADVQTRQSSHGDLSHVDTIIVPTLFMGKLIGQKGEFKRHLEADTNTKVNVPSRRDSSEVVTIRGYDAQAVESCRTRIELLIDNALQAARPTHFLSIPLLSDGFEQSLKHFQDRCIEMEGAGLQSELFTEYTSFHLTLGTLKLYSDSQLQQATEVLEKCRAALHDFFQEPNDREIIVKGVEYMNDDPDAVDVLYAKVDSQSLQRASDIVITAFRGAGLLEKEFEREHVKLHATLINSKRRHTGSGGAKRTPSRRITFNASNILKTFRNHEFGRIRCDQLHLSKMRQRRMNKYYTPEAIVEF